MACENLVYLCVFNSKEYVNLLKMLMMSVKFYSKTDNIHFLVFTNAKFEQDINEISSLLEIPIKTKFIEIETVHQALCARAHIFDYEEIHLYKKILYIDTDILVQNDLTEIFNLKIENKIYALKEGTIEHEYHGGPMFDFNTIDKDIHGMNSGILLFQNTKIMQKIFKNVIKDIEKYILLKKPLPPLGDQPFINYHFIKHSRQDTTLLDNYCKIYCIDPPPPPSEPNSIVLAHFVWPIGDANHKKERMISHMNHLLNNHINIYNAHENPETYDKTVIVGKQYSWGSGYIKFEDNGFLRTSWVGGTYAWLDKCTIEASWSIYRHVLKMNESYTSFISIRKGDLDCVRGEIM